jgi:hypothetical protein
MDYGGVGRGVFRGSTALTRRTPSHGKGTAVELSRNLEGMGGVGRQDGRQRHPAADPVSTVLNVPSSPSGCLGSGV